MLCSRRTNKFSRFLYIPIRTSFHPSYQEWFIQLRKPFSNRLGDLSNIFSRHAWASCVQSQYFRIQTVPIIKTWRKTIQNFEIDRYRLTRQTRRCQGFVLYKKRQYGLSVVLFIAPTHKKLVLIDSYVNTQYLLVIIAFPRKHSS